MEPPSNKAFQHSLDLTHDELEHFIPELLSELWELGSMPEYILEIFVRNHLGKDCSIHLTTPVMNR